MLMNNADSKHYAIHINLKSEKLIKKKMTSFYC